MKWRSIGRHCVNSLMWESTKFHCGGPESSKEKLREQYRDLFHNELGKLTRFKATLKVLPDAQPKFHRPRSVPFALKEAVERELDRLEMAGVIEKTTHCDWAAPIVVVQHQ